MGRIAAFALVAFCVACAHAPSPPPLERVAAIAAPAPAPEPAEETPPAPSFAQPLVERHETRAIVLMYHSIDHGQTLRTVWPWDFEAQIARLVDNGTEIVRMSQLIAFLEGRIERLPRRVAVLTIDDGEVLFHKYAWPILKRRRVPFALGIITKPTEVAAHARALSWTHLREMLDSGLCEIASHSHMHDALTALKPEEVDRELVLSRQLIEQHLGVVPEAFIYPIGATNADIMQRVRGAGYQAAFGAVGSVIDASAPLYNLPRFKVQQNTSLDAMKVFFDVRR